jgi:hypothetical protein
VGRQGRFCHPDLRLDKRWSHGEPVEARSHVPPGEREPSSWPAGRIPASLAAPPRWPNSQEFGPGAAHLALPSWRGMLPAHAGRVSDTNFVQSPNSELWEAERRISRCPHEILRCAPHARADKFVTRLSGTRVVASALNGAWVDPELARKILRHAQVLADVVEILVRVTSNPIVELDAVLVRADVVAVRLQHRPGVEVVEA